MPHQTRHTKKSKQPKRNKPLGIESDEQLELHRELALLRIAGGARPGRRKRKLIEERMRKLDEVQKRNGTYGQPPRQAEDRDDGSDESA